ncbi:hypothetical protein BO94DRAFT_556220 [Aspergillus sclerotioniger CBS 115572]|uniref:Uncharacterized protein n=1 Tax=Aspergillus sclerotioniger CBS 115572 TaxID=1450535 RepID=A0A317WST9_9EURO|nr:hypothetical protein BO94DRAFT_556220 [Aspergillus sclerotioniger CBS 115572]PWY88831.1 hypothetical protein BO94DRAFT_556220 [Aspergillus sclerotioniger CBS 115572]
MTPHAQLLSSFEAAPNADENEVQKRDTNDLHPPQLSGIVADSDALQPTKQQLEDALAKSRSYWYKHGIKPELANPHHMLMKVLSMHAGPHTTHSHHVGASLSPLLCLQASVSWHVDESTDCDRIERDKTNIVLLYIGTKASVPYALNGNGFRHWVGTEDETAGRGGMKYTESKAAVYRQTTQYTPTHMIDIGEADDDTISWWSSILAPGDGWKAIMKECDDGEFLAPWSVICRSQQSFAIQCKRKTATGDFPPIPMSSSRAFEALSRFALMYNLGSQFPVALGTAITVPTHNCHGSTIQLPPPTLTGAQFAIQTLFMSSLCGMFWEPGVPCNLVSAWLHPILNEVPEGTKFEDLPGLYYDILAIICGIRRPTISALWLGAVAGGLAPIILRRTRRGRPPLDPVAFPWTGCLQSFMDIAGMGPYIIDQYKKQVRRADVWRLLHLPTTEEDDLSYNYPPRTPWEPCGMMETRNCALRVASHLDCPRHHLRYQYWIWEPENGPAIQDKGFSMATVMPTTLDVDSLRVQDLQRFPHKPLDQDASEEASLDIFRWFITNGEGFPPGMIYKDEWLEGLDDEDTDEDQEDDGMKSNSSRANHPNNLEKWLATLQDPST